MTKSKRSSTLKWIAAVGTAVIGGVITAIVVEIIPMPHIGVDGEEVNLSSRPRAPDLTSGSSLIGEGTMLVFLKPGEEQSIKAQDLFERKQGSPQAGCATSSVRISWMVRDPYPKGGEEFQVQRYLPMGGGIKETLGEGRTGETGVSYCSEIFLKNTSLETYSVELRYASGNG